MSRRGRAEEKGTTRVMRTRVGVFIGQRVPRRLSASSKSIIFLMKFFVCRLPVCRELVRRPFARGPASIVRVCFFFLDRSLDLLSDRFGGGLDVHRRSSGSARYGSQSGWRARSRHLAQGYLLESSSADDNRGDPQTA